MRATEAHGSPAHCADASRYAPPIAKEAQRLRDLSSCNQDASAQQILPFLLHDRGRFIRRGRLPVLDRWQEARGQSKLNLLHLCHTIEAGKLELLRKSTQLLQHLL